MRRGCCGKKLSCSEVLSGARNRYSDENLSGKRQIRSWVVNAYSDGTDESNGSAIRKDFEEGRVPSRSSGFQEKSLLNHPHLRPVILELVSAVQADDVVFAGRSGDVPVRVDGAAFGRSGRGKRLGNLFVRAANREQLENFIDHGLLFYRTHFRVLPAGNTRKQGKWDCLPKKNYAVAVVMRGESVIEVASLLVPFISFAPGFLMSIEPLNHAPSSIEILWQTTSPPSDPSFLMSTRSLAVTLPFTLPRTTTSLALMLAWTWPLRPTVTRLPGRLTEPSTRPSIYSDSEPVTSPLMTSDFPMVACSVLLRTALRGAATGVGSLGLSGGSAHNWFLRFRCGFLVRIRWRGARASRLPHYCSTSFRFYGNAQPATFSPAAIKYILAVGGQPSKAMAR